MMDSNDAVFANFIVKPDKARPIPVKPITETSRIHTRLMLKARLTGSVILIRASSNRDLSAVTSSTTYVLTVKISQNGYGFMISCSMVPTCFSKEILTDNSEIMPDAMIQYMYPME